jgi:hypothetical protein
MTYIYDVKQDREIPVEPASAQRHDAMMAREDLYDYDEAQAVWYEEDYWKMEEERQAVLERMIDEVKNSMYVPDEADKLEYLMWWYYALENMQDRMQAELLYVFKSVWGCPEADFPSYIRDMRLEPEDITEALKGDHACLITDDEDAWKTVCHMMNLVDRMPQAYREVLFGGECVLEGLQTLLREDMTFDSEWGYVVPFHYSDGFRAPADPLFKFLDTYTGEDFLVDVYRPVLLEKGIV